jgi:pimeloyl-ACP methyl ester carboxylesterase
LKQEIIDIGGRKLRLVSAGAGTPAVILEAGAGGFSAVWGPVQREVSRFARVYSYDRAGYGRSDPPPHGEPRTSGNAVRDLHALLVAAQIAPPYVLVGHSLGGFHARLYTARYPADVAGLVLVDADVEEEWTRAMPDEHRKGLDFMTAFLRVAKSFAHIGLPQAAARVRPPYSLRKLPVSEMREVLRHGFTVSALRTLHSEFDNLDVSAREIRSSNRELGDRPLVVIRHGIPPRRLPGTSRERAREIEDTLEMMQRRMAQWSRRGRLVVSQHSCHVIHIDEPHVVVEAIRDVLMYVRAQAGLGSRGQKL